MKHLENDKNSTIAIRTLETEKRWLYIVGTYRQWQAPGEGPANSDIARQISRFNKICSILDNICRSGFSVVWCGDKNIDRNFTNDPLKRPKIKALMPILEDCLDRNNLKQINFKPTWHMPGKPSSLLDIFFSNASQRMDGVEYYIRT